MFRRFFPVAGLSLAIAVIGCSKTPTPAGHGPGGAHESIAVTDDNFEEVVLKSDVPVLVDFWATWCGPCVAIGPAVEEVAADYKGRAKVAKVDFERSPKSAEKYGVDAIPLLIVFKGGTEVARQEGVDDSRDYKKQIAELLEKAL